MSTEVFVALGSNLGKKLDNLSHAIKLIPLKRLYISSLYHSRALTLPHAPAHWLSKNYINLVVRGLTNLNVHEFFRTIKMIEQKLGRKEAKRYAPRVIDIDLLYWGNKKINSTSLTVPHASLQMRDFVMLPLLEISNNLNHQPSLLRPNLHNLQRNVYAQAKFYLNLSHD